MKRQQFLIKNHHTIDGTCLIPRGLDPGSGSGIFPKPGSGLSSEVGSEYGKYQTESVTTSGNVRIGK